MENNYILQPTQDGKGWVLTDTDSLIVIQWANKQFNATQRVVNLHEIDNPNPLTLAKIMREMSDWLTINHPDKL